MFYICISSSFCQLKFCNWEYLFVICLFRITNINIKAIKILKKSANLNHTYKRYFDGYILWHTPVMVWQLWCFYRQPCTDLIIESYGIFQFFSIWVFFTNIHDSQDSRRRGRLSLWFLSTISTSFADTYTLAGRLQQTAQVCT